MIISLLLALFATTGGVIIFLGLIVAFIIASALQSKKSPGNTDISTKQTAPSIPQGYCRYHLIDITTKKIVGGGNDYLAICKQKREMGLGIVIKDNEYKKKY